MPFTLIDDANAATAGAGLVLNSPVPPTAFAEGDVVVLTFVSKLGSGSIATPANWTSILQATLGTGADAPSAGTVRVGAFSRTVPAGGMTLPSFTVSSTSGSILSVGTLLFRPDSPGETLTITATSGSDTSAGTSWSVTGGSTLPFVTDDIAIVIAGVTANTPVWSGDSISATGATFGSITSQWNAQTSTGNDLRHLVRRTTCTGGTATAAPVHTMTADIGTNATGGAVFLRLHTSTPKPTTVLNLKDNAGGNHFDVGIGHFSPFDHVTTNLATIEGGFDDPPWWVTVGNGPYQVQHRVQINAETSSGGTEYPRSEMGELNEAGSARASWDPASNRHFLRWRSNVTHQPPIKPSTVCAQVHDGTSDAVQVLTRLSGGVKQLVVRINGVTVTNPILINNFVENVPFDGLIELIDGDLYIFIDDFSVPIYTVPDFSSTTTCYFKVGCYAQTNETIDTGTDYCEVLVSNVQHWHTGWATPENYFGLPTADAGADASGIEAVTFNRTGSDSGTGITDRVWSVISGPAGGGVGTVIGTAAALSWAPPAPGTYRLRYAVTNAEGTQFDDMVLTAAPSLPIVETVIEPTPLSVAAVTQISAPVEVAAEVLSVSVAHQVLLGVIEVVDETVAVDAQLRPPVNLDLVDVVIESSSLTVSDGVTLSSALDVVVEPLEVSAAGSLGIQPVEVVSDVLAVSVASSVSIDPIDVIIESGSSNPGFGFSITLLDVVAEIVDIVSVHSEASVDVIDVVVEPLFAFAPNTNAIPLNIEVEVLDVISSVPARGLIRRPPHEFIDASVLRRPAPARNRGYRYLSVDASTMRVTNEFEFAQVQYSFQRNAAGEFGAALDLYSPDAKFLIPQETYLVVERSGVPFWCGFMWKPRRNGKILEVGAQGIWSLFGHRHIRDTKSYFNTDRAYIVRQLVQYAQLGNGGNLHVSTGSETLSGPPLSEVLYPWWEDKVVATEAENLALIDPEFNFRIEGRWLPGNVLTFDFIIDPVHPEISPHRLVYGGNVDDYEWEPIAPSPNHVDAFGGFDGPAMIRRSAQNLDVLARQPRIEVSTGNRDILSEGPIQDLAISTIKKLSGAPAQPTVVMQAGSDPQLGVLKIGQEVEVDIDDGYVQVHGRYIIERIEVSVPDGAADALGAETLRIGFESLVDGGLIGAF